MKYITLTLLLIACTLMAQEKKEYVSIEATRVEVNGREYHGKITGNVYGKMLILYEVKYPLILPNGFSEQAIRKQALSMKIEYYDDKGVKHEKTFLGKLPEVKQKMNNIKKAKKEKVKDVK